MTAIHQSVEAPPEVLSPPPDEVEMPTLPPEPANNVMTTPPSFRAPPGPVNEFLRAEQSRNQERCELLRQSYQIDLATTDFHSRCLPQWDFRNHDREIIWFYHYQSGRINDRNLQVFGVVDGLGTPLFQHPGMAGDPLALLDSAYTAFQWIRLDSPNIALIAAASGPWAEAAAAIDLFQVNDSKRPARRTWRFADDTYPEQPPRSPEVIGFLDANGDGLRDLCLLHHEHLNEGSPQQVARYHAFQSELGTFKEQATLLPAPLPQAFQALMEVALSGQPSATPYLVRPQAMEPVYKPISEDLTGDDDRDRSGVSAE